MLPLVRGRSLAWEMRGYGDSAPEGVAADLSLSAQADYLLRWLDAVGVEEPAVLAGHDLGGGVAQIAAVRSPDRFAGLVLTNAVCYDSWPIPSVKMMQRLAPVLKHLPDAAVYPTLVQLLRRGHDARHNAQEATAVHWAGYASHGAARTLIRQVEPLDAADTLAIADRLPSLGLPARVVWGEADQFQKVSYGGRLARDLGTEVVRIPGGRHFTPEDHPGVVADAINGLLGT